MTDGKAETGSSKSDLTGAQVKPTRIRSAKLLRVVRRILPLESKYSRFVDGYDRFPGYVSVPWGRFALHYPSGWIRQLGGTVWRGPKADNPEFFAILAPRLSHLKSGHIVDVGAAMGVYELNFRLFTAAPIIAYEPAPELFEVTQNNVHFNNLADVEVRNVACGAQCGTAILNLGLNSFLAAEGAPVNHRTVEVKVVRLDDDLAALRSVSLIKIDCEGFEYQVIAGAAETIWKHRPALFIELHPQWIGHYGFSVRNICDTLRPTYNLHFWEFRHTERSTNRLVRFLGRYSNLGRKLADERTMLSLAEGADKPAQLFLLAIPKKSAD